LLAQGNLGKKQMLRYFKLKADSGVLIKFDSFESFQKLKDAKTDVVSL